MARPRSGKTNFALAAVAALAMLPSAASHAQRPDTRALSCAQARQAVETAGALVMTTGTHTFARIVAGIGHCERGQDIEVKRAPTADSPNCPVGFICRDRLNQPRIIFPPGKR